MSGAPLPSSFDGDEDFFSESRWQKFSRRLKEDPLIPLGMALTTWALISATRSMRAGDHARTNIMFRRRIYAQGFTVAAMAVGGMYWKEDRDKRKEFDKLQLEKQRTAKRDAWLRELEARDEEEKMLKAKRERRRAMLKEKKEAAEAGELATAVAKGTEVQQVEVAEKKSVLESNEQKGVLAAAKELLWKRN
ncbi:hypoxia induced protein conserved region-domain-containing protein [Phyllosticta citriasiana]|uniref:Hypoxia induced protein conserved region-domain-containing protein n=1 Tax=Phyllosticta citriasiana TaxID=595635 RepID=A0ABR1KPU7_9PEZI